MKKYLGIALLALGLSAPVTVNATTIFADNFNSNAADQLDTAPAGWTIKNGTVDIIGAGGSFDWYSGNGSYIDLDGSMAALGQNSYMLSNTVFNVIGGQGYTFSFDYGINHNDGSDSDQIIMGIYNFTTNALENLITVDANALDHTSGLFTFTSFFGVANYSTQVSLFFKGISVGDADQSGGIIDNVSVSTVPIPAAGLLLLSGLAGLGGASRLRRKSA